MRGVRDKRRVVGGHSVGVSCFTLDGASRGVGRNMGLSGNEVNRVSNEAFSLVYIQATGASSILLYRAARRISWNVRHSDVILLWENACVVVLPETPVKGAQAVARRISTCLVDLVEAELYALGGSIAQALLRRLHAERAVVVQREIESFSIPGTT